MLTISSIVVAPAPTLAPVAKVQPVSAAKPSLAVSPENIGPRVAAVAAAEGNQVLAAPTVGVFSPVEPVRQAMTTETMPSVLSQPRSLPAPPMVWPNAVARVATEDEPPAYDTDEPGADVQSVESVLAWHHGKGRRRRQARSPESDEAPDEESHTPRDPSAEDHARGAELIHALVGLKAKGIAAEARGNPHRGITPPLAPAGAEAVKAAQSYALTAPGGRTEHGASLEEQA